MKDLGIVRATWTACVAFAAIALLVAFVLDQRSIGLGLALGLVVGSANGELIRRLIVRRAPFVFASVARMMAMSGVAIALAFAFGASPVAVLLGVAAAQFVMVGAAVREGLRA